MKHLQNEWNIRIERAIAEEIEPRFKKIKEMSVLVKEMNHLCENLIETRSTKIIKCKEDQIKDYLIKVRAEIAEPTTLQIVENNQINFANLFNAFELVLPFISDYVNNFQSRSSASLEYESEILHKLLSKSQAIERQLKRLELSTQDDLFTVNAGLEEDDSINLPNNAIMATPPVSTTYSRADVKPRILPQRLALIGPTRSGPYFPRDSVQSSSRKNAAKSSTQDIAIKIPTAADILKLCESARKIKKSNKLPQVQLTNYQDLSISMSHLGMTESCNPPKNTSTPLNELNIQPDESRYLKIYCSPLLSGKKMQHLRSDEFQTPLRGSTDITPLRKTTPNKKQLKRLSVETSPSGRLEGFLSIKFNSSEHDQRKDKVNDVVSNLVRFFSLTTYIHF